MGEIAQKKTMYHGEASRMGKFQCTVASDVLKSKYSKGGADKFYVILTINGADRNYEIENPECGKVFDGLKGSTVTLEFAGSRSDARVNVVGNPVSGGQQRQPQNKPAPQQERRQDPPPKEQRKEPESTLTPEQAIASARKQMMKFANLHILAFDAAIFVLKETARKHPDLAKFTFEDVRALANGLHIDGKGIWLYNLMPEGVMPEPKPRGAK